MYRKVLSDTRVKAGSQYDASAAYHHLPSVSVTNGGIDQSSTDGG